MMKAIFSGVRRELIDALVKLLEGKASDDDVKEPAVAAIAYHADPRADKVLAESVFPDSAAAKPMQGLVG